MALIYEDGSGVTGAESYLSEADSLTYHANRGNNTWATITQAQREQALRRATDYMMEAYRLDWKGFRTKATQALDWPRGYVPIPDAVTFTGAYGAMVAPNVVPVEVKNACAELALKAAAGDLLIDQTQGVINEHIGPISVTYDKYSPQGTRYKAIDALLRPYLVSGSGASTRLIRT